jgi:hypothetical protein
MPSSARWLILAGYLTPPVVTGAVALLLPRSAGELGGAAAFALALMAALVLSGVWFLAGTLTGADAVRLARQEGRRVRWFDYLLLAAGALPLVGIAVALALP